MPSVIEIVSNHEAISDVVGIERVPPVCLDIASYYTGKTQEVMAQRGYTRYTIEVIIPDSLPGDPL